MLDIRRRGEVPDAVAQTPLGGESEETATTAVSDRSEASCSAVPCVVHPSWENPTVAIPIAPIAAPQSPGFSQTGICMKFFFALWKD